MTAERARRRGRLRVLLGAAPGVGKTFEMLAEGRRLRSEGRDVVIAVVDSHDRVTTRALTTGIPAVQRSPHSPAHIADTELDLDALLARAPEIALVDEFAHSNVLGSAHPKRWQDVDVLLDAGIDVITTLNVQHIESLRVVVERITGVAQDETIPDAVVRGADEIEMVDLAPESLRDRLAAGLIYPAERVDAALSNYFRLGNLTALRELALLWLADEVDSELRSYRADHGIEVPWQTRERIVVALTGGPEGDTLLRRGSRIASRSAGAELLAVHVVAHDSLRDQTPASLTAQRTLVESLGGTFHQIVGHDIAAALVGFAQGADATQLVIGVSRRGRLSAALTGPGIGAEVIRRSGDIDVHIVTHAAAGGRAALPRITGGALGWRREVLGFVVALVLGPLLSWFMLTFRSPESITAEVLSYQLLVVVVALVGGLRPAVFAAVLSGITLDVLFVAPQFSMAVAHPLHALALALYVVIAVLVSIIVDQTARRARTARRAAAEAELLAAVAGNVLRGDNAVLALVGRTREAFGLDGVRLLRPDGEVLATNGELSSGAKTTTIPVEGADRTTRAVLELSGDRLDAAARRLLEAIVAQLSVAIEHDDLRAAAREAVALAETDQVRSALLSAVSHDLRRPLASAVAAIGGLRRTRTLSDADREELLATADESLATLSSLVTDLLDVSRVEAGVLAVSAAPMDPVGAILAATGELGLGPADVVLSFDPELPPVLADPVLLQRVLVNLLANAHRHAPAGSAVIITTSAIDERVEIRIIDRGDGVPVERREGIFQPFQRFGDTDNTTGLGLGLALSRGFVEGMGGNLTPEDTPGGGLTMVVSLQRANDVRDTEEAE